MLENAMPGEALVPNGVTAENLKAASQNSLPNKSLQDMAEKLEKSEAGRKKLRQAISMLKEKVEANEKVLQVNEILRQECEKERLRAEAERNRAEEEKALREQVEKDGLSMKEQLVRVLQRLDAVERSGKSDRSENERMRKEMKQAISGLGGAVNAIEAARSSFDGLEKNLLGETSKAVRASNKSTSLAETAISDAEGAQGTAVAAEKLSQSLVSRIEALQKQGTTLDQRVALLQQEIRTRQSKPLHSEPKTNGNRASTRPSLVPESPSTSTMVLSKTQQACTLMTTSPRTANKDCPSERAPRLSPAVAHNAEVVSSFVDVAKRPADTDLVGACGSRIPKTIQNTANAAGVAGVETLRETHAMDIAVRGVSSAVVDGKVADVSVHRVGIVDKSRPNSSRGNTVREALEAAKQKRNILRTTSTSKVVPQPGKSSSCQRSTPGTPTNHVMHAAEDRAVDGDDFRVRVQVDSGYGSMPALPEDERNDHISTSVCVPLRTDGNHGSNAECCPRRRPCLKKNSVSRERGEEGAETKLAIANPLFPGKGNKSKMPKGGTKIVENGKNRREKLPVALLKEITKLFFKEKKSHAKVEQKLAALQKALQISDDDEVPKQGMLETTLQKKSRKRGRIESLRETGKKVPRVQCGERTVNATSTENHAVASPGHLLTSSDAHGVAEVGARELKRNNSAAAAATEEDSTDPLQPQANKSRYSWPAGRRNDFSEAAGLQCVHISEDLDGPQFPDVEEGGGVPVTSPPPVFDSLTASAAPGPLAQQSQETVMDSENLSGGGLSKGWDSDSVTSEDEMGEEDWWMDRWTERLVLLSPTLPEVPPPSVPEGEVPDSNGPSPWPSDLEDISLFLGVLPTISEDAFEQDRTAATLPDGGGSKLESEDASGVTPVIGENNKELHPKPEATETIMSNLHSTEEKSAGNIFVQCSESGPKPSEKSDNCVEGEKQESRSDGLPPTCGSSLSSESRFESSLFLPHDVGGRSSGKSEASDHRMAVDSGAGTDDAARNSPDAVKEEKTDAVNHVESLSPYSLELVLGGSVYESRGNSTTGSIMEQEGPLIFNINMADKVVLGFGRSRNLLLEGLNHATVGTLGSCQAVATKLASLFACSGLSRGDLMCIFTASVVDAHALWDNEKNTSCVSSERAFLQLLINRVKQVLATDVFQTILSPHRAFLLFAVQLQKFLIHGSIQPEFTQPAVALSEGCRAMEPFYHFVAPSSKLKRLRALIDGGKLLAVFCETIGELGILRNSVYRVLRFCDMDSQCLLATVSSFACAGCKSLFAVDDDDVVGQAVRVVISELIRDVQSGEQADPGSAVKVEEKVEEEVVVECAMESQQGAVTGKAEESGECSELRESLRTLRDAIGEEGDHSFEAFVPRVVKLFHEVISAPIGCCLKDNRHLFQRCLRRMACNQNRPMARIFADFVDRESDPRFERCQTEEEEHCWRYVRAKSSIDEPLSQSEHDDNVVEEWEQKFYDITNAVELVASHLGWEWTYNDFIVEHLWKLVSPGAPAMTLACVAHTFGLLGRLGREVDSTELPGVDELRKSLLVILISDQTSSSSSECSPAPNFSFRAQVAAAQALLVLSSFNRKDEIIPSHDPEKIFSKSSELHAKSVKSLWNWVKAFKPEIQQVLPVTVRSALLSIDESNFVPIF